ncbi:MAG: hypothetical protein M3442_16060 [Chloroflexota bacterium]|nr:hypothetical protein [Chloroflexota bacterium]
MPVAAAGRSFEERTRAFQRREEIVDRLTIAIGFVELLLHERLGQLTADQRRALRSVEGSLAQLRLLLLGPSPTVF